MRRIYESEALRRDDEDPFVPNEDGGRREGHVDWGNVSHALFPAALRPWAVEVSVETDTAVYEPDEPVRFRVTFRNRLPVPVTLVTDSPRRWEWSLDGRPEASTVASDPPTEPTRFEFARSERKRFHRRWDQRVRESEREVARGRARRTHPLGRYQRRPRGRPPPRRDDVPHRLTVLRAGVDNIAHSTAG